MYLHITLKENSSTRRHRDRELSRTRKPYFTRIGRERQRDRETETETERKPWIKKINQSEYHKNKKRKKEKKGRKKGTERRKRKKKRKKKKKEEKKKREENGKKVANSTRCSQAVTHPSTNRARRCLTSVIGREPVLSTWYGRWRQTAKHIRL